MIPFLFFARGNEFRVQLPEKRETQSVQMRRRERDLWLFVRRGHTVKNSSLQRVGQAMIWMRHFPTTMHSNRPFILLCLTRHFTHKGMKTEREERMENRLVLPMWERKKEKKNQIWMHLNDICRSFVSQRFLPPFSFMELLSVPFSFSCQPPKCALLYCWKGRPIWLPAFAFFFFSSFLRFFSTIDLLIVTLWYTWFEQADGGNLF